MEQGADCYRRFLSGDENAFAEMVETYREGLIFFLCRYVNSVETAEDLAEDVFVEVLLHPKRYRFQCALKTWLFAIGCHKAVDYLRRHSRLQLCDMEAAAELADLRSLEEDVLRSEENKMLNRALGEISPDYRNAIHLVYFEGLSCREAARVLGKTRKQTENLLYRGKLSLRKILSKEGFDFEKR